MKNKYKSAGIWNIFCGVLFTIVYIGSVACLGVQMFEWEDIAASTYYFSLVIFVAAYLWDSFITFPFFMILTGTEMLAERKKGIGVKAWIVFNALFKGLAVVYELSLGYLFLTTSTLVLVLCGVALIVTAVFILISVVMDFRALFGKQKKRKNA